MKFSDKDIQNIADLARLELSSEEKVLYGKQLSSITAYVEKLQGVSSSDDISSASENYNVWRKDEVDAWDLNESEEALDQSEREAGLIKVKRVL